MSETILEQPTAFSPDSVVPAAEPTTTPPTATEIKPEIDPVLQALPTPLQTYITTTLPLLEGWCSPAKAAAMCRLILDQMPTLVVEIGVFGGRSLIPQALALHINHQGRLFGIDPWDTEISIEGSIDPVNDKWWRELNLTTIMRGCLDAIRAAGVDRHIAILPFHSHDCVSNFRGLSIDILHIDGCHSESASTRDVRDWLPMVKKRGHIWLDDVEWESMAKAVALMDRACDRVLQVGNCVLFQKR